jgi:hypothetical protein
LVIDSQLTKGVYKFVFSVAADFFKIKGHVKGKEILKDLRVVLIDNKSTMNIDVVNVDADNNFNPDCFINYEIELIQTAVRSFQTNQEAISFLHSEQGRSTKLKIKSGTFFDNQQPSIKKQLSDWVAEEIRQLELKNRKAADKDLVLDPESKVQTSLSVAKLAVLIRLMLVDKIIINKSVAPMLRTVTKLFTTLQKDEISFGSLETKYHAPDKTTLNTMKEMMRKWVGILGKL